MIHREKNIDAKVIKMGDLLQLPSLAIPIYQRPYKWQENHVLQLIDDISFFRHKSSYRLGTIVVHKDKNNQLNIVDGQQRTITCLLIFKSILSIIKTDDSPLKKEINNISENLIDFKFTNPISFKNIQQNDNVINRAISKLDDTFVRFFLEKCEFIYFELKDITEAFQFFDSQNARGKDLDPHDLLKAYHLREYDGDEKANKIKDVETWENYQSSVLVRLFSEYLFRIRGWARNQSSRDFTKNDIYLFKGVNINKLGEYHYADTLRILHYFIDDYNNSLYKQIYFQHKDYPFQLDAPIINGRRFFEMIGYYKKIFDETVKNIVSNPALSLNSKQIFETLSRYKGNLRVGDQYVRTLFDCSLVFYVDKFGFSEINFAIEKLFAWAYKLRLLYYALQFSSVDNYVLESNIFSDIKNNYTPREALSRPIVYDITIKRKISEIEGVLKKLYYI